jgi:hypothetical protein
MPICLLKFYNVFIQSFDAMITQRNRNDYVTTSDTIAHARDGSIACIRNQAYIRDPACIRYPSSIETFDLDPRRISEARIVFESLLVLEDLRYLEVLA